MLSSLSPRSRRGLTAASAVVGGAIWVSTFVRLGAGPGEVARALALWCLAVLPVGALVTRGIGRSVWVLPVERLALAALVGLPIAAFLGYLVSVAGGTRLLPWLWASLAVAWLTTRRRRLSPLDWSHPVNGALCLLCGAAALVLTRGFEAFRPLPGGAQLYDHLIEQAIHVAFSWEALRGLPLAELPTAAGLPFPHYHALGYVPLAWAARWAGVGLLTVHHALVPPLVVALLAGGAYLAARARTGRPAAALATVVALFFVVTVVENVWVERNFRGRVPVEFALRSTSGGAGTLVFLAVAALLAAQRRGEERGPLVIAAALAGIAYGAKAQMFLLLGGAFLLLLAALALRARARDALLAFAVLVACAAPLALIGRTSTPLGRPSFAPGLFAQQCGLGPFPGRHGRLVLWLAGGPLALWSILRFSPIVPLFALSRLRRWRACPAVDLFLALGMVVALVFALGLAARELQRGEVSTLVVREGLFALQVLAVGVDVGVLAWLMGRGGGDGSRIVLAITAATAIALLPAAWRLPVHVHGSPPALLSRGEMGALGYLRDATPLDAVVAHLRRASTPALQPQEPDLQAMPLVAALAGRRTVLEYYRPDVDRSVNRRRSLRRLFGTSDAGEAEAILRRFGVDYVLEYRRQPLGFTSPALSVAYEAEDVRLWWVAPRIRVPSSVASHGPAADPSDVKPQ